MIYIIEYTYIHAHTHMDDDCNEMEEERLSDSSPSVAAQVLSLIPDLLALMLIIILLQFLAAMFNVLGMYHVL